MRFKVHGVAVLVVAALAIIGQAQSDPFAQLDALVVKAGRGKLSAADVQTARDTIARVKADTVDHKAILAAIEKLLPPVKPPVENAPAPPTTPPPTVPPVVTPPPVTPPPVTPPPSTPPSSGQALLKPSDLQFLGSCDMKPGNVDAASDVITVRHVGAESRLLFLHTAGSATGRVDEVPSSACALGGYSEASARRWLAVAPGINGNRTGAWFDDAKGRLWVTNADDYITAPAPTRIFTRVLNDDGSVGQLLGPIALQGVGQRLTFGGVQPVPASLQAQGLPAFVAGWGGYSSIKSNAVSFGLALFGFDEPAGRTALSTVTLANHATAAMPPDWYGKGDPTGRDRGFRLSIPIQYFDGGDLRPNGQNGPMPTFPPVAGASWLSPAPDGKARWIDGDEYGATGVFIDTPKVRGFLAVANVCTGKCWYGNSELHSEGRAWEWHIFDPVDFLTVAQSAAITPFILHPSNLQPRVMAPFVPPSTDLSRLAREMSAAFDSVSGRLFLKIGFDDPVHRYIARVYVFQVPR